MMSTLGTMIKRFSVRDYMHEGEENASREGRGYGDVDKLDDDRDGGGVVISSQSDSKC